MSELVVIQKAARGKVVNLAASKASTINFMLRDQKRLWNWFHNLNVEHYQNTGEFIFYHEAASLLTRQRRAGLSPTAVWSPSNNVSEATSGHSRTASLGRR